MSRSQANEKTSTLLDCAISAKPTIVSHPPTYIGLRTARYGPKATNARGRIEWRGRALAADGEERHARERQRNTGHEDGHAQRPRPRRQRAAEHCVELSGPQPDHGPQPDEHRGKRDGANRGEQHGHEITS